VNSLFRLKHGEHVLVVVTSLPSLYFDKERCVTLPNEAQFPNYVFGDGAAAAVLSAGESGSGQVIATWSGCDPTQQLGWTALSGGERPDVAYAINFKMVHDSYVPAIMAAVNGLREEHPSLDLAKVDRVLFHQANGALPDVAAQALGIPLDKLAHNAHDRANTAATTVPTMLADELNVGNIGDGSRVVLAAVGAGLSRSAALIEY
jgi:3-oxoacyl-[acyl-carrier-protein] synthase-3